MKAGHELKEAVGVFDSEKRLEQAIDTLLSSGFDRGELSLLAGQKAIEEKLGHAYRRVEELEDDPAAPSVAFISRETLGDAEGALIGIPMYIFGVTAAGMAAVAGGPLAITLAAVAAGMGAGAAVGAVLARFVDKQHVDFIDTQLEHGGILLWVRTWTPEDERTATDILKAAGARDIHIHDIGADAKALATPEAVAQVSWLSDAEKITLLRQWEFDTLAMLRGEDEGLRNGEGEKLTRIQKLIASLG
ncbi:hypothetical protein [Henriciella mobilis]|uniref:hypothetical protein n=1 Tax=Henriciella mobilis TaxID=2305467 RepID=UPI0018EF90FA|nr:hypothetical protein [Henriciella mobilis]